MSSKKQTARIFRAKEFEPEADKFNFAKDPLKLNSGGLIIGYKYDGSKLRVSTHKLRCPFGLQVNMNNDGYNLVMSLDDSEESQSLRDMMSKFDEVIKTSGVENADSWFTKKGGKAPKEAVIIDKFHSTVKLPADESRDALFKVKLPCKKVQVQDSANPEGTREEDEFDVKVFNNKKEPIPVNSDTLAAGCHVKIVMTATSVWSTTAGFGATWKAEQIMVYPNEKNTLPDAWVGGFSDDEDEDDELHEPAFDDEDEDDGSEEEEEAEAEASEEQEDDEQQDEDEDEDEPEADEPEAEEEEEPEPPKPVKKPTPRAKKTPAAKK
jgi:hypothetical protein